MLTTPRARLAGAVNTLCLEADGTIMAILPMALAWSVILNNLGWEIRHKRVLILGLEVQRGALEPLLGNHSIL